METPSGEGLDAAIDSAILSLLAKRAPGKSICPSEAARAVAPEDWRALLKAVRTRAAVLSSEGRLEITRKGKAIPPDQARGVVRLRLPP